MTSWSHVLKYVRVCAESIGAFFKFIFSLVLCLSGYLRGWVVAVWAVCLAVFGFGVPGNRKGVGGAFGEVGLDVWRVVVGTDIHYVMPEARGPSVYGLGSVVFVLLRRCFFDKRFGLFCWLLASGAVVWRGWSPLACLWLCALSGLWVLSLHLLARRFPVGPVPWRRIHAWAHAVAHAHNPVRPLRLPAALYGALGSAPSGVVRDYILEVLGCAPESVVVLRNVADMDSARAEFVVTPLPVAVAPFGDMRAGVTWRGGRLCDCVDGTVTEHFPYAPLGAQVYVSSGLFSTRYAVQRLPKGSGLPRYVLVKAGWVWRPWVHVLGLAELKPISVNVPAVSNGEVVQGLYNALLTDELDHNGHRNVHVFLEQTFTYVKVTLEAALSARQASRHASFKTVDASVHYYIKGPNTTHMQDAAATALVEALGTGWRPWGDVGVVMQPTRDPGYDVSAQRYVSGLPVQEGRGRATLICNALVTDPYGRPLAVDHTISVAQLANTIEQRIETKRGNPGVDADVMPAMAEFVLCYVQRSHAELIETTIESITDTATKKARMDAVTGVAVEVDSRVKAFLKGEAGNRSKAGRCINTVSEQTLLQASNCIRPALRALRGVDFCAVGLTYDEIASELSQVSAGQAMDSGDQSAFDARHGFVSYVLWLTWLTAASGQALSAESCMAVLQVMCSPVNMGQKRTYNSGTMMASGHPLVTWGNTILGAFVLFLAARRAGFSVAEIVKHRLIGLCGGDDNASVKRVVVDGVLREFPQKCKTEAAASLGHRMTFDEVDELLLFLGRYWCPQKGLGSVCDVPRALTKWHLAYAAQGVTAQEALWNKAKGMAQTDASTPVVGPLVKAILATCPPGWIMKPNREDAWWQQAFGQHGASVSLRECVPEARLLEVWARQLGVQPADLVAFEESIPEKFWPMTCLEPIRVPAEPDVTTTALYGQPFKIAEVNEPIKIKDGVAKEVRCVVVATSQGLLAGMRAICAGGGIEAAARGPIFTSDYELSEEWAADAGAGAGYSMSIQGKYDVADLFRRRDFLPVTLETFAEPELLKMSALQRVEKLWPSAAAPVEAPAPTDVGEAPEPVRPPDIGQCFGGAGPGERLRVEDDFEFALGPACQGAMIVDIHPLGAGTGLLSEQPVFQRVEGGASPNSARDERPEYEQWEDEERYYPLWEYPPKVAKSSGMLKEKYRSRRDDWREATNQARLAAGMPLLAWPGRPLDLEEGGGAQVADREPSDAAPPRGGGRRGRRGKRLTSLVVLAIALLATAPGGHGVENVGAVFYGAINPGDRQLPEGGCGTGGFLRGGASAPATHRVVVPYWTTGFRKGVGVVYPGRSPAHKATVGESLMGYVTPAQNERLTVRKSGPQGSVPFIVASSSISVVPGTQKPVAALGQPKLFLRLRRKKGKFTWDAEAHKVIATAEAALSPATSADGPLPWGGTSTCAYRSGGTTHSVTTNVWLQGSSTMWLAADHPFVLKDAPGCRAKGFEPDATASAIVYTPDGPVAFTFRGSAVEYVGGVGRVSVSAEQFAKAPKVQWSKVPAGASVVVAPYRGSVRCVSSADILHYEDVCVPTDACDITFRGGAYRANTHSGDCGAPIMGPGGVVGMHAAGGGDANAFITPVMSAEGKGKTVVRITAPPPARRRSVSASSRGSVVSRRSSVAGKVSEGRARTPVRRTREDGIVGMSAAPSDYIGPSGSSRGDLVSTYIDSLVNPWSGAMTRLPDHCITPTSLMKVFANRTYSLANVTRDGPNFFWGMHTRLGQYSPSVLNAAYVVPLEAGGIATYAATGNLAPTSVYRYSPGDILSCCQWQGALNVTILGTATSGLNPVSGFWGDDFGAQETNMLPYMSAFRTLSAAMRVRIVGLPTGQFMTPGKIYFAQVRYDTEDFPITEQDYVTLETKGRATHVSADAVREAGSKTIFYTPDGQEKFGMQSSFVAPPGVFQPSRTDSLLTTTQKGIRVFPGFNEYANLSGSAGQLSAAECIVPYFTAGTTGTSLGAQGTADASDAAVADATSVLLIAYFGAADGVVVEIDYAKIIEFIPNKGAPSGIEALVQLPASDAMDKIFAGAAVLANSRARMVQSPGDKTIIGDTRDFSSPPSVESRRVKSAIMNAVNGNRGRAVRTGEGFWDALSDAAGAALGSLGSALSSGGGAGDGGDYHRPSRPGARRR